MITSNLVELAIHKIGEKRHFLYTFESFRFNNSILLCMPEFFYVFGLGFIKAIGILLILITLLPFTRFQAWWVRMFDFPRVQISIMIAVYFGLYIPFILAHTYGDYCFVAIGIFCFFLQLIRIAPYTRFYKHQVLKSSTQVASGYSISFLVVNVFMYNREAKRCLDMLGNASPDVVLAVETDKWWQKELDVLKEEYPHALAAPLGNTYGMLLYSKLPLEHPEIKYLLEHDIPSVHTKIILPGGVKIKFFGIHPRPPMPQESISSVKRDAELVMVGREAKRTNMPVVVAGDLNDVAWSHTTHLFQRISGLLDPRIGRGMFSTFNSKSWFLRWPLDHIFFSHEFRVMQIARLEHIGSDHFPIFLKLSYEPQIKHEQEKPEGGVGDIEEANELLKNGYRRD